MDLEAEYNNRRRVPGHPAVIAGWQRDAAAYRDTAGGERGLAYAPGERARLDMFPPRRGDDPDTPVLLFIHGGYWQGLSGAFFSHMAAGANDLGLTMAVPSYDLCPAVALADIVEQLQRCCAFLWHRLGRRLVACGHSAGGHLTAAMLQTDWPALDPALPDDLVPAGLPISGVFELEPLIPTSINEALGLDAETARALSPALWPVPTGRRLVAWVGAEESGEFRRQTRDIARLYQDSGAAARAVELEGADHFTVVAPLADPTSAMVADLAALAAGVRAR